MLISRSGQGTGGPCPSDDSWIYNKASNEWSELNRCSSPKISPAMARLPSRNTSVVRVVLWGGNAESRTTLAVGVLLLITLIWQRSLAARNKVSLS